MSLTTPHTIIVNSRAIHAHSDHVMLSEHMKFYYKNKLVRDMDIKSKQTTHKYSWETLLTSFQTGGLKTEEY
jgi:hypothetical protein